MMIKRLLNLLLFTLFSMFVAIKTLAKQVDSVSLKAKPMLCVTDNANYQCEIDLSLFWRSSKVGQYCLFLHEDAEALQCWLQHNQGQWQKTKTIEYYAKFWIATEKSSLKMAEVRVDVLNINPKDKRRNRRRRHVWSLF